MYRLYTSFSPLWAISVSQFLLRVLFVYLSLSFVYRLCISVSPSCTVCVPQFLLRVPFVYLCFSVVGHMCTSVSPSCTDCVPLFFLRVPFVYLCLSFVYRLCTSVYSSCPVCVTLFLLCGPFAHRLYILCVYFLHSLCAFILVSFVHAFRTCIKQRGAKETKEETKGQNSCSWERIVAFSFVVQSWILYIFISCFFAWYLSDLSLSLFFIR